MFDLFLYESQTSHTYIRYVYVLVYVYTYVSMESEDGEMEIEPPYNHNHNLRKYVILRIFPPTLNSQCQNFPRLSTVTNMML
jgi:hypothetical protein